MLISLLDLMFCLVSNDTIRESQSFSSTLSVDIFRSLVYTHHRLQPHRESGLDQRKGPLSGDQKTVPWDGLVRD